MNGCAVRAAALLVVGLACLQAQAIDTVQWVGGASADWNDPNVWKNTTTNTTGDANTIFGQRNGSDGMNTTSLATTRARNIVIGGGSRVEYYHPTPDSDFRVLQGSTMTIKEGAKWVQETDNTYSENGWTQMDMSLLTLDNGTFSRTGESPAGDGGGLVLFGSYRDDANKDRLGLPPKINVDFKNGGRLENTGQVWFGADDEHSPGVRVNWNINNGTVDLTGGTIPQTNSTLAVAADLAFFYDYDENAGAPKNEEWKINFTGPGSITVDSAGINVYRQDEFGVWTGGTPVSYQDLWDQGILRANGLSGAATQPANFGDFFTVTGTPGANDYKLTSNTPTVDTVQWVGGASGDWNDPNVWKNTTTNATGDANTIFGQRNGSDGMNTTSMATTRARNIVIGGGARVEYYHPTPDSDFRIQQGSTLTIKEGAKWVQETDNTYSENGWTQMDMSNLILDGGTFSRTGESPAGDGGGLVLFGSYRDDANKDRLGLPPEIHVEIKNGGRLENTGQVWFGADDEHSPGVRVDWTINNGTVDLTGGTIPQTNSTLAVAADLAFFYDFDENNGVPKNEEWSINFTGPGSITVDSAGINVYQQDQFGVWTGGTPISYQDLWNLGILKANGLSGAATQAANFSDFFSVTGTPGSNNYILTSLLPGSSLGGDFNHDGKVDGADFVVWQRGLGTTYTSADLATWKANYGQGSAVGAAAAVPEPAAAVLACLAVGAALSWRRRS
jgi:hypothetical protein